MKTFVRNLGARVCLVLPLLWFAQPETAHAQAVTDAEVEKFLHRFDDEPSVRDVQKAAINYYNVSPDTISTLRKRTRRKALLPGLSIGFSNSLSSFSRGEDNIIYRARGELASIIKEDSDYLGFNVNLSWGLDRLIFNSEELDVLSLIGIQDGIQREVTALYYVRRRLQIELMLKPPETLEARLSSRLRLEELTGLLDAYTGGMFSRTIASRTGGKVGTLPSAKPTSGAAAAEPNERNLTMRK